MDRRGKDTKKRGFIMATDQQLQQTIETYIREGLPLGDEDQLWIEFLKDPEWFDYFITEIHLRSIGKRLSE